jgi:capsular polysaccharide biosynthesis protein
MDSPTLDVVDDAFLSRASRGPLRSLQPPTRWVRGAVYDATGSLVVPSQKIGGANGYVVAPADPTTTKVGKDAERLTGSWLYGGHWLQHFGHFILETLTTLWPRDLEVEGLVLHKFFNRPFSVEPYQRRLLDLAGYEGLPVRVVESRPLRVDRLHVPSRAVVANGWAHPEARQVWDRIATAYRGSNGPRLVYFSRTAFNDAQRASGKETRTTAERDRSLDAAFAGAGFTTTRPEELSIDDQLSLVANADVLAASASSALHLACFAPTGARVIEVADDRLPARLTGMQRLIDTACGHREAFFRADTSTDEIAAGLAQLDLTERTAHG